MSMIAFVLPVMRMHFFRQLIPVSLQNNLYCAGHRHGVADKYRSLTRAHSCRHLPNLQQPIHDTCIPDSKQGVLKRKPAHFFNNKE